MLVSGSFVEKGRVIFLWFLLGLLTAPIGSYAQLGNQAQFKTMNPKELIHAWENTGRNERRLIEDALIVNRSYSLPALRDAALYGNSQRKLFACAMLAEMQDKDSVDILLAVTHDLDEKVRTRAITALRVIGNPEVAPRMRQLVQTTQEGSVLKAALATLGRLGSTQDVPLIRQLLPHSDEHVRVIAAGALAMLGSKEGQDILLMSTRRSNPLTQKSAIFALGYLDSEEAQKRLTDIINDPIGQWKSYAVIALAQQELKSKTPHEKVEHLGQLMQHHDPLVLQWAMQQLADLDTPEAIRMLQELVEKENRLGQQVLRLLKARKGE